MINLLSDILLQLVTGTIIKKQVYSENQATCYCNSCKIFGCIGIIEIRDIQNWIQNNKSLRRHQNVNGYDDTTDKRTYNSKHGQILEKERLDKVACLFIAVISVRDKGNTDGWYILEETLDSIFDGTSDLVKAGDSWTAMKWAASIFVPSKNLTNNGLFGRNSMRSAYLCNSITENLQQR